MRRIAFLPSAFEDLKRWSTKAPQIYQKIKALLKDMEHGPFSQQLCEPEPLTHDLKGLWAKRINDEHYLVYKVTDEEIVIVSCRFYYQ
jgi:toxin YoeB